MASDSLRVDRWLWASRFYKTRKLATRAINGGKVHIDQQKIKPSRRIKCGDILEIHLDQQDMTVCVQGLASRRKSAAEAAQLYEIHSQIMHRSKPPRASGAAGTINNPHPEKRPQKQERRRLIAWQRHVD